MQTEYMTDYMLVLHLLPVTVWWQQDNDSRCIFKIKREQLYNTVTKHTCHGI
jgi:hypothetical protein